MVNLSIPKSTAEVGNLIKNFFVGAEAVYDVAKAASTPILQVALRTLS